MVALNLMVAVVAIVVAIVMAGVMAVMMPIVRSTPVMLILRHSMLLGFGPGSCMVLAPVLSLLAPLCILR